MEGIIFKYLTNTLTSKIKLKQLSFVKLYYFTGIQEEIDNALADFFFGCNIPFNIIESVYFKNLINKLNPDYQVPTRKTLSTSLLEKLYSLAELYQ